METRAENRRAAQYLRMSTDRQDLSIRQQSDVNEAHARRHGYDLVCSYFDEGISGLTIDKRDGLKALIATVISGKADYSVILVYDVSRWGRFQNPDESAHYEFICAAAGVRIEYCAEAFANDGSPTSALMKHMKRAMAAEYSRDLAIKVTRGQHHQVRAGCFPGGNVPYGYRRVIIDRQGVQFEPPTEAFWQKRQGYHTRLVPGADIEVKTVQRIFRMYARGISVSNITRLINRDGILNRLGHPWTTKNIGYVLDNPTYMGRVIRGRRPGKLKGCKTSRAPETEWLIVDDAVQPLIRRKQFEAISRTRKEKARRGTVDEALEDVKRLAAEYGTISEQILNDHGRWWSAFYIRRLGNTEEIRRLLNVPPPEQYRYLAASIKRAHQAQLDMGHILTDDDMLDRARSLLLAKGRLSRTLLDRAEGVPCSTTFHSRFGSMEELYRRVGYEPTQQQRKAIRNARYIERADPETLLARASL
jgi:DNA invertase Pin-like site-specific DNA recombinase